MPSMAETTVDIFYNAENVLYILVYCDITINKLLEI